MALLPRGFAKGLLLGGLAALVWGILGDRNRRATVAGPIVERAESLPFVGPHLYAFFAGTMMADLYQAVAVDVLAEVNSGELLEIGAGVGYLAVELAERNRDIQLTAMNREPGMSYATESRVHASGLGRQVKVSRGDATDIPYPNEYFDGVISLGGPQHWRTPELVLAEIHRVLKPGGRALIYNLRREMPVEGWDRVREGLQPALQPVFDMVVIGPAGRTPGEGEMAAMVSRTPFGSGQISSLDVEIGGVTAPVLTKLSVTK